MLLRQNPGFLGYFYPHLLIKYREGILFKALKTSQLTFFKKISVVIIKTLEIFLLVR